MVQIQTHLTEHQRTLLFDILKRKKTTLQYQTCPLECLPVDIELDEGAAPQNYVPYHILQAHKECLC